MLDFKTYIKKGLTIMIEHRSYFNKAKAGEHHDIQQAAFFREKRIVSAGWSMGGETNYNSFGEFKKDFQRKNENWNKQSVHYLFDNLNKDDYIWILDEGIYYVAQVPDDPKNLFQYTNSAEFLKYDAAAYIKNIDWHEVGTEENVPGSVSTAKGRLRAAFQRIDNQDGQYEYENDKYTITSLIAKQVISKKIKKFPLRKQDIFSLIGAIGLEDLVAMWLFETHQYVVIPSTNKIGTQKYEYVMIDGTKKTNKKIYVQTKNGDVDLSTKEFEHLISNKMQNEVWLLTTQGKINNRPDLKFVKISGDNRKITPYKIEELLEFIFDLKNLNILPPMVSTWLDFFDWC